MENFPWGALYPPYGQDPSSSQPVLSHGAQRKARQRERTEEIKRRLQDVLQYKRPEFKNGKKNRPSKTIVVDDLMAAAIARVKAELRGGGDMDSTGGSSSAIPAPPHVKMISSLRDVMLSSQTLGTLLIQRKDVCVVESSLAMENFCPWEMTRGYRNQGIDSFVHTEDVDEFLGFLHAASAGAAGARVSVRLLRLCMDGGSRCLLARYVRKEVSLAHASPDGTTLLLTLDLDASDVEPLAVSQGFLREFLREAKANSGPCAFRLVNDGEGCVQFMRWAAARGVRLAGGGGSWGGGAQDSAQRQVLNKVWDDTFNLTSIGEMLLESFPHYPVLEADPLGRPRLQVASRITHPEYQTEWSPYCCWSPSGEMCTMGVLSEIGSLGHVGALLIGTEGGEPAFMDLFINMRDKMGHGVEGIWGWYFGHHHATLLGHVRTMPGKVYKRNCYGIKTEVRSEELEATLRDMAQRSETDPDATFWVLPSCLDGLQCMGGGDM